jgi:hypothetical protein
MTATNKRLLIFESRGDSNRCTPYRGKPDQHTTRFSRSVRVWSKTICISRSPHIATLREMQQIWTDPTPPEKNGSRHNPWVHTQFLSWANQWSRGRKSSSCRWPTTRLTGPISLACDRYVQYLLAGVNPSVLNWHRRGYKLRGAGLPHTTPRPSQSVVSTFHLRAPSGLQFNQVPSTKLGHLS